MHLQSRIVLLAGVSILALAVSAPEPLAADLKPLLAKAPPAPAFNPWTWWVEGGAQSVSGPDSNIGGLTPQFAPGKTNWGWNAAAGFDYRLDAFWHLSADFRYGQNKQRTSNGNQNFVGRLCTPVFCSPTVVSAQGPNIATHSEHNWAADFMVGRDIGLGGSSRVKLGLRIAEITTKTRGTLAATFTTSNVTVNGSQNYSQDQRFLGAGPRVALEGNIPLSGPWSLEYMGGLAGLYGLRSLNQTPGTINFSFPGVVIPGLTAICFTCATNTASSSNSFVFNADAMLGVSYALTPNAKLTASYRIDYYNNPLVALNSAGGAVAVSRLYQSPSLRLTVNY